MKLKHPIVKLALWALLLGALTAAAACTGSDPSRAAPPAPLADSSPFYHEINWTDGDRAGYTVALFYDTDNTGHDGNLIVQGIPAEDPTNSYIWNIAGVPNGRYYIYVAINSETRSSYTYTPEPLVISHTETCLPLAGRVNLLSNSGFEEGLLSPAEWQVDEPDVFRERSATYEWVDDPDQAHSGSRAIKIASTFNGVNSDSAWQDRVIVEAGPLALPIPGGKYLLTAWVKTEDVAPGRVMFRIKYYDDSGDPLPLTGHGQDTYFVGGPHTASWTRIALLLNPPHWDSPPYPAPARASQISINFSLDNSPGTLWMDDLSLVEISETEYQQFSPNNRYSPPAITPAGRPLSLPSAPEGGFSVQQAADGAWWLVSPDGEAFWATGIDTASNDKLLTATGMAKSEYTREAQYRASHDLKFNQGGRDKDTSGEYGSTQGLIYWLNFSSEPNINIDPEKWVLKDRNGNLIADYGHYFPDVFSPVWQENAITEANLLREDDGWLLDSDSVLGYWTDNEWAYGDLYDFLWGDTARLAFADWLQGKNELPSVDAVFAAAGSDINLNVPPGYELSTPYPNIAALNQAWSSSYHRYSYRAFVDVYGRDKPYIRAHNDPVAADIYAFERVIYKIYVDTIIDNIRRVEAEHIASTGRGHQRLIFSNRFDIGHPAAVAALQRNMDIFSRFDVIAVNLYPADDQQITFNSRELLEMVKSTFHDTTGQPLLIAEFGLAAEDADDYQSDPPLIVSRWRDKTVSYQYQRGWGYHNLVSTWANLPYVVGARWYKWPNGYGNAENGDPRNSGVVDDSDNYYTALTDNIRSINSQLATIGRAGNFTLDDINWDSVALKLCGDE